MARGQLMQARQQADRVVRNFNQWIVAEGGTPVLRKNNDKLITGPFYADVTITDNAVVNADLTLQSVWDLRVQELYGSSSGSDVKATLRLTGVQLIILDASFRSEALALKEALMDDAYVRVQRGDKVMKLPLIRHVWEPWVDTQVTQATAANGDFAVLKGLPRRLDGGGVNIDLFQDSLEFRLDTAINWTSGDIAAKVACYGFMAPDNYPGALSGDGSSCGMGSGDEDIGSVGPETFANLRVEGFGIPPSINYMPGAGLIG